MTYQTQKREKEGFLNKKQERALAIIGGIIFLFSISIIALQFSPLAPFEDVEEFYILSGDTIKNFNFDRFNEDEIGAGNSLYENKLKFEDEPLWEITKDDLEILYAKTDEATDITYMFYKMRFTKKINIYTNVKLSDAMPQQTKRTYGGSLGTYKHFGWLGGNPILQWNGDIFYDYYDHGDILAWNKARHSWGGNLEMSFDINQDPLPDIFEKNTTNSKWEKEFAYIGVSSLAITDKIAGKLSEDEPVFYTDTPDHESGTTNAQRSTGTGTIKGGYSGKWDTNIRITPLETPTKTFGLEGVQLQSINTSLHPTLKDGSPIFINTKDRQTSQKDCKFILNVGRISPLVKEYSAKLTFNRQYIETWDYIDSYIPLTIGVELRHDNNYPTTWIKTQAVHVQNRYFQAELSCVMNVWSAYKLTVLNSVLDDYDAETPNEEYHDLAYLITASASGNSAEIFTGERTILGMGLFGDIAIIGLILVGVAIAGIYLFSRIKRAREGFIPIRPK